MILISLRLVLAGSVVPGSIGFRTHGSLAYFYSHSTSRALEILDSQKSETF